MSDLEQKNQSETEVETENGTSAEAQAPAAKPTLFQRYKAHMKKWWWVYVIVVCCIVLVVVLPMYVSLSLCALKTRTDNVNQSLRRRSPFRQQIYQRLRIRLHRPENHKPNPGFFPCLPSARSQGQRPLQQRQRPSQRLQRGGLQPARLGRRLGSQQ